MDSYKYKSGAQKRKEKAERENKGRKGQKTLQTLGFTSAKQTEKSDEHLPVVDEVQDKLHISCTSSATRGTAESTEVEQVEVIPVNETECDQRDDGTTVPTEPESDNNVKHQQTMRHVPAPDKKPYDFDIGNLEGLHVSHIQVQEAVRRGPQACPKQLPVDSLGHHIPVNIFYKLLTNGEKVHRNWLVWSRTGQSLFCFPCRLFSKLPEGKRSALALPSGCIGKNWRKLHDRIPDHENSNDHKMCYVNWHNLEMRVQHELSIDCILSENIKNESSRWKQVLRKILDFSLFLSAGALPFRGSNTTIGEAKICNFLGILELIGHYNPVLNEHLTKVKESQTRNHRLQVHYLSPRIQNEFIECCTDHVIRVILHEGERAKYYSIVLDQTPDCGHLEQTVFILRCLVGQGDGGKRKFCSSAIQNS